MKKLFLVVFTLFIVSSAAWAQSGADKNVTGKIYTQAEKIKLDLLGYPKTDWSQGNPNSVTGIVKWSEGFEGATFPPAGWAVHQLDGGTNPWIRYTSGPIFGTASAAVRWESSSLANDDWLVTPSFLVDAADKLNFYAVGSSTFVDSIIVYASTAGGVPPTGYTRIAAFRPLATAAKYEVSLAAFAGQTIYIGFQYKELDQLRLYLDSVYVETGVPNDVGMVSHNVGGELNGGVPLTPTATVKNFGSATQTFNVTMTINPGGYTSTKQVTGLAADQTANVTFDSWTPTTGSFTAKAYTQLATDQNRANDTLTRTALVVQYIYDNGSLVTNPGGGFGGADLSMLQSALNTYGWGSQSTANNWVTDDFTVPSNETWSIDAIKVFSYQTGSTLTPTYTSAKMVIYNGRPDLPTSSVVFGDETTERFISAAWSGIYRALSTTPTDNTRPIMGVLTGAPTVLGPGNYWVMWSLAGTLASGPWAPPISILGTYETGNAWSRQAGVWVPLRDSSTGSASGYAQGLPFKIVGSVQAVPVELTSFMATVLKNDVSLLWSTATETNNMGFEVERKAANGTFQKVGYVAGNGTTTERKEYSFTDAGLASGKYTYRLRQVDFDGTSEYSNEVEADVNIPSEYSLGQNFPNPFNPSTSIEFALKADAKVTLRLFDALGQEVRTILSDNYATGNYKIDFNASGLNSGVYFYTIEASGVDGSKFTSTKKMILMK